jgi:hypothetical protein
MMVPTGPDGMPDHSNRSVLVDAYINIEDTVVAPVLDDLKELFNRFSGAGGRMGTGRKPIVDIKVEFDDDNEQEAVLAGFEFKGKVHNHNLVKVLNGGGPQGVNVFHIHIAALEKEKIIPRN